MDNVLKYKNYSASVNFSADDEVFYGKVLNINDLVSFEASSVKRLKTAFNEAVEDYLDLCGTISKTTDSPM